MSREPTVRARAQRRAQPALDDMLTVVRLGPSATLEPTAVLDLGTDDANVTPVWMRLLYGAIAVGAAAFVAGVIVPAVSRAGSSASPTTDGSAAAALATTPPAPPIAAHVAPASGNSIAAAVAGTRRVAVGNDAASLEEDAVIAELLAELEAPPSEAAAETPRARPHRRHHRGRR